MSKWWSGTLAIGAIAALIGVNFVRPATGAPRHENNGEVETEPPLQVPTSRLRTALHCERAVTHARQEPVLLLSGTGVSGTEGWRDGLQPVLLRDGHPSCFLNLPEHATGDMQTAAEYVVFGVRQIAKRAGRTLAIYGLSQGALLARMALTYWRSIRRSVTDAVLLAGPQHGSTVMFGNCPADGCAAAAWQRSVGSNLLKTLNRGDETPAPTAYTTVRTLNDAIVQPTDDSDPTSALAGASNIVVQSVCPGRVVAHVALGDDSVAYAALLDAMSHGGPAQPARFSESVCANPFAAGEDPVQVSEGVGRLQTNGAKNINSAPKLSREPRVRYRRPRSSMSSASSLDTVQSRSGSRL